MRKIDPRDLAFWLSVLALIATRLVLISDLSVHVVYSPHDDSMYVERAYHLLRGEGFGPYDSTIIVKYPGISLWLAGVRAIGLPYLISINALHIIAGLYMVAALLRCAVNRWVVLAALGLYLFNPIAFGSEWFRVLREPLSTSLFIVMLAATLHILKVLENGRIPWTHAAIFTAAFAFSVFLREDDRLLWGLLFLSGAALAWWAMRLPGKRKALAFVAITVIASAALAKGYEYSLRAFYERHYGLPIIHELSEGEYPRFLAAVRSIHSAKDNRMVMASQETLAKLYIEVPRLRPVIERLPPPGPRSFSCQFHGVCSEWASGWIALWIRDAAFRAGMTPSLLQAQDYYRAARQDIEQACTTGKFTCTEKGKGLVPPMELRWTRAYVAEALRLLKTLVAPDPHTVGAQPKSDDVPIEVVRQYEGVVMTTRPQIDVNTTYAAEENALGFIRIILARILKWVNALLLLAGAAALILRAWWSDRYPLGPLAMLGLVFALYSVLRLATLSYVAVYLGSFDSRMMFSLYAAGVFLAPTLISDAVAVVRRR
jgi:hypothetical protein